MLQWKVVLGVFAVLVISFSASHAQPARSLKQQIVGTWDFVRSEVIAPDGKKSFPFGETPKGILIVTSDGRFAQIHVAGDVPRIASNNRLTGTAEEYSEIMRRSVSAFGTYTVDEDKKTVTYHIVSSSFPNWQGESQTRTIDKLNDEEFINTNPNVAVAAAAPATFTGGRSRLAGTRRAKSQLRCISPFAMTSFCP